MEKLDADAARLAAPAFKPGGALEESRPGGSTPSPSASPPPPSDKQPCLSRVPGTGKVTLRPRRTGRAPCPPGQLSQMDCIALRHTPAPLLPYGPGAPAGSALPGRSSAAPTAARSAAVRPG